MRRIIADAGPPARAAIVGLACLVPALCAAQDLTPRAYFPTPVSSNAVILTYAFSDGDVVFDRHCRWPIPAARSI